VELQRLRASSERKFQRWFFETRAELERSQEVNAMLESALNEERRGRADAITDAVDQERANSKTQKQLTEMRKELQISKDEARRAWEELGRREQEERDRTISLQSGQPTIVGGVQVVPMTQGVPSRHGSTREQRDYQSDYSIPHGYDEYSQAPAVGSTYQSAGASTAVASAGRGGGGAFYQQPQTTLHEGGPASHSGAGSEGGYSEGEYAIDAFGNFIRDAQGNKIPFRGGTASPRSDSDAAAEEYETPATHPGGYGSASTPTSAGQWAEPTSSAQDQAYAAGYQSAPGWDTVPRHHHPTRLSDVIEEDDERSRTTPSQVSRG
jgi:hypothetical protein